MIKELIISNYSFRNLATEALRPNKLLKPFDMVIDLKPFLSDANVQNLANNYYCNTLINTLANYTTNTNFGYIYDFMIFIDLLVDLYLAI